MLMDYQKVATVAELQDNSMIGVTIGNEEILVARINGDYFALDGWCSHAMGLLYEGDLQAEDYEVECPVHQGCFDLRSGEPTCPPAEDPVAVYEVRVEGEDIYVGPKP